jgi:hypothetical protein
MFHSPSLGICKFLRIKLLIFFTTQLIIGLYIAFHFFKVSQFAFWLIAACSFYLWLVNQIVRISGCRIEDNVLILKKIANKTELMPVERAIIQPTYVGRQLVVIPY